MFAKPLNNSSSLNSQVKRKTQHSDHKKRGGETRSSTSLMFRLTLLLISAALGVLHHQHTEEAGLDARLGLVYTAYVAPENLPALYYILHLWKN